MTTTEARPLYEIAKDIAANWHPSPAAWPYWDAMRHLQSVDDFYFEDSAKSVVLYFLSNAKTWRGEDARRIKAELKAMVK